MTSSRFFSGLLAAACCLCPCTLTAGQQRVQNLQLEITGLPPGATVEVALVAANFNKADNLTATSAGRVDTVYDFANFGKPQLAPQERIQVVMVDCKDPKRVLRVVFVAEGGQAPRECDEQQQDTAKGCRCRRVVVVLLPTTTGFRVDFAGGRAEALGPSMAQREGDGAPAVGWLIDVDFGQASLRDANKGCDEFIAELPGATCDVDGNVPMWSVDAGVTFARYVMFKVGYLNIGKVKLNARASQGPLSFQADGEFGSARGVTVAVGGRVPIGRLVPVFYIGGFRWNAPSSLRFTANIPGQPPISETTSQKDESWDLMAGGGLEVWIGRNVGLSGGFRYIPLKAGVETADRGEVDEAFRSFYVGLKIGRP